jgi:ribonuclease D
VSRLRTVRDTVAADLDLDPGVLCARDRLEAVARRNPRTAEELGAVGELRQWQIAVLGEAMLRALRGTPAGTTGARPPAAAERSPYRDA